jgi:transposase
MLYVGLDLGGKRTRVHVRDAQGKPIDSGWACNLAELKQMLGRWGPELSVVMESTTGAFILHDQLKGQVAEVKVAHPSDLRAIAHARIKNDRLDAEKLSELNRGDLIPQVWVPPAESRDQRELILEQARVRQMIAREKTKVRALLRRWGRAEAVPKPFTKAGGIALAEVPLPEGAGFVLQQKIQRIQNLKEAEQELRRQILKQIPTDERQRWLQSIPGVGECAARWLSNVLGDVKRFPDGRHVASYIGLVPSERTSCTEPRRGGITKRGNVWLRWMMIQCAWAAIRSFRKDPNRQWRTMYAELVNRGKSKKRAVVAVANRLTRVAYALLRDGRPYESRSRPARQEVPKGTQKIYTVKGTGPTAP